MKERKHRYTPLDMEEPETQSMLSLGRKNRIWFYLEWIPITLLSVGILLKRQGSEFWPYLIISGGITASIIFLLFSTRLLSPQKTNRLETILSVVSGLLVTFGIGALIAKYWYWDVASQLIIASIYAGLGMVLVVAVAFIMNIRKPESARFYRSLLARLFIFIALVYNLGIL